MKQKMLVVKKTQETPDTVTITFKGEQKVDFKPGQFYMFELMVEGKPVKRAYSISSSPARNEMLEITVKQMPFGKVSTQLCGINAGDEITADGPFGHFVFDPENMKEIVLIAAGSGIAPFRCFCQYITDKKLPTKVTLVYGNKTEEDIICRKDLEEFGRKIKGMKLVFTLSREEKKGFRHGRIDDALIKEIVSEKAGANFFICGPPEMVQGTKKLLEDNGIAKEKIKVEVYG